MNGICDFQFSLWDAATAGIRFGGIQEVLALPVTGGRFTTVLNDFCEFCFAYGGSWLEIAVRCPAGSGSYTALSPRQVLTAVPYALSLRPGASIIGPSDSPSGYGLFVNARESQRRGLWSGYAAGYHGS